MFDYFYGNEPNQFAFYSVPQVLFTDEMFKSLSCEAKILYGIMLNKSSLSVKNGWQDKDGRVFIYFKRDEICEKLGCKKDKATKILNELDVESGIGLIKRINQGQGKPAIIYVLNFATMFKKEEKTNYKADDTQQNNTTSGNKTAFQKAEKSPSELSVCGEKNDKSPSNELSGNKIAFQKAEIPPSRGRKNRLLESGKTAPHLISNTKRDILSEYPSYHVNPTEGIKPPCDVIDMTDNKTKRVELSTEYRKSLEAVIKENVEYDWWVSAFQAEPKYRPCGSIAELNEIIDIMVDTLCSDSDEIKLGKHIQTLETVKSRFLKIRQPHIESLFEALEATTSKITNIREYLKVAIYNITFTDNLGTNAKVRNEIWNAETALQAESEKPSFDLAEYEKYAQSLDYDSIRLGSRTDGGHTLCSEDTK